MVSQPVYKLADLTSRYITRNILLFSFFFVFVISGVVFCVPFLFYPKFFVISERTSYEFHGILLYNFEIRKWENLSQGNRG